MQRIPFSCYLDQKQLQELNKKAKADDKSVAELIRQAIKEFLDKK